MENDKPKSQETETAERLLAMKKSFYADTPISLALLQEMDELFDYPQKGRMPCLMIIGDPNNGKSRLLEQFYERHLPYVDPVTLPEPRSPSRPMPPIWMARLRMSNSLPAPTKSETSRPAPGPRFGATRFPGLMS
jgi:hypothetical protein